MQCIELGSDLGEWNERLNVIPPTRRSNANGITDRTVVSWCVAFGHVLRNLGNVVSHIQVAGRRYQFHDPNCADMDTDWQNKTESGELEDSEGNVESEASS